MKWLREKEGAPVEDDKKHTQTHRVLRKQTISRTIFLYCIAFFCARSCSFSSRMIMHYTACWRFMGQHEWCVYVRKRVCSNDLFYIFILFHFGCEQIHQIWHVLLCMHCSLFSDGCPVCVRCGTIKSSKRMSNGSV